MPVSQAHAFYSLSKSSTNTAHPIQDETTSPSKHESWRHTDSKLECENVDDDDGKCHFNSLVETREELIARIKREQRDSWLRNTDAQYCQPQSAQLCAGKANHVSTQRHTPAEERIEDPPSLERPKSALHAGDFRETSPIKQTPGLHAVKTFATPTRPSQEKQVDALLPSRNWASQSCRETPISGLPATKTRIDGLDSVPVDYCSRGESYSSLSSSFAFRPPTSPLAHHFNSNDFNAGEEISSRYRSRSPKGASRRRTFSPRSFRKAQHDTDGHAVSSPHFWPPPALRREETFPYQAHQPRRSLASYSELGSFSASQPSSARTRRFSLTAEAASPLQRAPMVGGYEESILRGRMSTLPSRPLDFIAEIGVSGRGNCRAKLKCPPHMSVPFPAVFYNYGTQRESSTSMNEGPSPYVGMIDLENFPQNPGQPAQDVSRDVQGLTNHTESNREGEQAKNGVDLAENRMRRRRLNSKTNQSSKARNTPRGGYQIPQQGQLQILIKNPSTTAVKLFLVPYDLSGMESGEKTFIRQRSYSAAPIIDMPSNMRKNLGTDRPEAAITNSDDPNERPVLRYLIHLNICCPSADRYYLYKSIRVVFANRVPDDKEKLRNETQLPEPRYSPYKTHPESHGRTRSHASQNGHAANDTHIYHILSPVRSNEGDPFVPKVAQDEKNKECVVDINRGKHNFVEKHTSLNIAPTSHHASSMTSDSMSVDFKTVLPSVKKTLLKENTLPLRIDSGTYPDTLPSEQLYMKRRREEYNSAEAGSKTPSRGSCSGLLAIQLRDWSAKAEAEENS